MINISQNRDLSTLSKNFYKSIEIELKKRLTSNKLFFNKYSTSSNILLGDYLENNLETIISDPLEDLLSNVKPELHDLFYREYKVVNKKPTDFKKKIDHVLFFEEHDNWKAYDFTTNLGINCCPYCNRTYITTLGTDRDKFSRPDIDHFLAKSKYGYLRFSFFNLIPSCIICNRNAKGRQSTTLTDNIYPYSEGFDDKTKFTYLPQKDGSNKIYFQHFGDRSHKKKSAKNISLFKLEEQYKTHSLEIEHLIELKRIHSSAYIENLMADYPGLIKNEKEAYYIAFGKEFEMINDEKRPLSKFTRDILDNLEMLKVLKIK